MITRKIFDVTKTCVGTATFGDDLIGVSVATKNQKLKDYIVSLKAKEYFWGIVGGDNRRVTLETVNFKEFDCEINFNGFYLEGGWLDV